MTKRKRLLILRLEGPLQAWGEQSKWDFRDSSSLPTKSGIVGLLGCALGEPRNSVMLVELAQSIEVAVRADRAGVRFVDFHTVQGQLQGKDGTVLMSAEGKSKKGGNTILTPRAYLQDACFTVFIETSEIWHDRIVAALKNPKWCIYLGRKSCVPSRPVLECENAEYASLIDAVKQYPAVVRADHVMQFECSTLDETTASVLRSDDLVGVNRQFDLRRVWRGVVREVPNVSD